MKNNNIYYKPELEELSIGTEYQINTLHTSDVMNETLDHFNVEDDKEYYNQVISTSTNLLKTYELLVNNHIRVKYLNEDDIIELGFEKKSWGNFIKDDYVLLFYGFENVDEKYNGWTIIQDYNVSNTDDLIYYPLFKGIIKNKIDLKRLLIQLDII